MWLKGSDRPTKIISTNLSYPDCLFVTRHGNVYVDNGRNVRVEMLTLNTNSSITVMDVKYSCYGLFVDINNNLYCFIGNFQ